MVTRQQLYHTEKLSPSEKNIKSSTTGTDNKRGLPGYGKFTWMDELLKRKGDPITHP